MVYVDKTVNQIDINIINMYWSHNRALNMYGRTEERNNSFTIIVGDFNTSLLLIDGISRQEINKEMEYLYSIMKQLGLTDLENMQQHQHVHILIKWTWNIFQYKSYIRLQNMS